MRSLLYALLLLGLLLAGYSYGKRVGTEDSEVRAERLVVERRGPAVITSVRNLARLEGAAFHMERIVDLKDTQSRFRGLVQAQDALLLVAVGDVVAGVDLNRLLEADVTISEQGRSVQLTLPSAEIFSASLDSSRTYVHSRKTDVLAERREDLETQARSQAQRSLREAALEAGILARAERSVQRSVTVLLQSLGFERVEVSFRSAPTLQ